MWEDERAVLAAVGGWVGRAEADGARSGDGPAEIGWVVQGRTSWVGDLRRERSGLDLFLT